MIYNTKAFRIQSGIGASLAAESGLEIHEQCGHALNDHTVTPSAAHDEILLTCPAESEQQ